jgi:hypothetical protein
MSGKRSKGSLERVMLQLRSTSHFFHLAIEFVISFLDHKVVVVLDIVRRDLVSAKLGP